MSDALDPATVAGGDILAVLVRLHGTLQAAPAALKPLVDDEAAALAARGRRLEDVAHEEHDALTAHWADLELAPLVDGLGRLLSTLRAEERADEAATALADAVDRGLYEELRPVCTARGWFDLVVVRPRETAFDPACHRVVDRRPWPAHDGVVLEIVRMGRRAVTTGALLEPALVVVAG